MQYQFDVFGRRMLVKRQEGRWLLHHFSATGIHRRVYDVVIPDDLQEHELAGFLDDIYHEYATDKHYEVTRIG